MAKNDKREAAAKTPRVAAQPRSRVVRVPDDVLGALKEHPKAKQAFDNFSPSHRREYVEWITEAKQKATRDRRLATMLEWLTQGKAWKGKDEKK